MTVAAVSNATSAPSLKDFLRSKKGLIEQALEGTALTPERLLSVTMTELRKTPTLRECTRESLFGALVQAAQLGLEPGSALGHCYLVPYRNKKAGTTECQFQLGYKGMIDLARRSGQILSLFAHCVYEHDHLELAYGLDPRLEHRPCLAADAGALVGAYAVAHLVGGGQQFVFLPRHKIEAIRAGSRSGRDGPWATHFDEMAQKTAARALFKWLPVSVEAMTAVGLDAQAEAGEPQDNGALLGDGDGGVLVDENGVIVDGSVRSAADLNQAL
ncbi:MAG: recombinase RecT [Rubrivivax sp.]|nr:recombinase RecT [Rubrivivax sp.]